MRWLIRIVGGLVAGFTCELYFPDYDSTSTGDLRFEPRGDATKVTWTNAGSVGRNPLMHCMALAMDRLVGPGFEAGLANLKVLAERRRGARNGPAAPGERRSAMMAA